MMCKWIIILIIVLALSVEAEDSIRFPVKGQTVNPANVQKLENKAVLDIAPTLKELGQGWNSNYLIYVVDPMGKPTEQVAANNPNPKGLLEELHRMMKKTGRTSYLRMHYLHETNPVPFQVHIQRWGDPEASAPEAFPRDAGDGADLAIGERACWVNGFGWGLHFQRGQYFVAIELAMNDEKFKAEKGRILQLARIIDAKIQEKPVGVEKQKASRLPAGNESLIQNSKSIRRELQPTKDSVPMIRRWMDLKPDKRVGQFCSRQVNTSFFEVSGVSENKT